MTALDCLAAVAALLVALPALVFGLECLAAFCLGLPRTRVRGERVPAVVLIPAHDEEELLHVALDSVMPQLAEGDRAVVVAHNCSDGTARVAREMGAEVVELSDDGSGGKPDALKGGLRALDEAPPQVVVIVDADCHACPGAIDALVRSVQASGAPTQGIYTFAAARECESSISSLALVVKNLVRPAGLARLGLPCLLNGSGSAYPFASIRNAPHGDGSIAEDYQLALDLATQGPAPRFCAEARVESRLPTRGKTALGQRKRWEHGHLSLVLRTPGILLSAIARGRWGKCVLALDLSVPPLSFFVLACLLASLFAGAVWALGGWSWPFLTAAASLALVGSSVVLAWLRFAGPMATFAALSSVPRYLVWKLPLYGAFVSNRERRWTKTERDGDR